MAKHRKTRQEKMIADQRHVSYHLETDTAQVSVPSEKKDSFTLDLPEKRPQAISYSYVSKDLRKTAAVTASIIIAQIFLFIVLNRVV